MTAYIILASFIHACIHSFTDISVPHIVAGAKAIKMTLTFIETKGKQTSSNGSDRK